MSKTLGQRSYEKWVQLVKWHSLAPTEWDQLPLSAKEGWEEIAGVAVDAFKEDLKDALIEGNIFTKDEWGVDNASRTNRTS